jgi:hypothetical protein
MEVSQLEILFVFLTTDGGRHATYSPEELC